MTLEARVECLELAIARMQRCGYRLLGIGAVALFACWVVAKRGDGQIPFQWLLGGIVVGVAITVLNSRRGGRAQTLKNDSAGHNQGISFRARDFTLEDQSGRIRGKLFSGYDGPQLSLYAEDGNERARLAVDNSGPRLILWNARGEQCATLAVHDSGTLSLWDKNGSERARLAIEEDGPGLYLWDENGTERAKLAVTDDVPILRLRDESGEANASITVAQMTTLCLADKTGANSAVICAGGNAVGMKLSGEGDFNALFGVEQDGAALSLRQREKALVSVELDGSGPEFNLKDKNGNLRAWLSTDDTGTQLGMCDEKGMARTWLSAMKDVSILRLADENGTVRATVGAMGDGSALVLLDEMQIQRAMLALTEDGAEMMLLDGCAKKRAAMCTINDRAGLSLFDQDERVIWTAVE